MRRRRTLVRMGTIVGVLLCAFLLTSAPGPEFTPRDKAFYADANTVNFVRPGLVFTIKSAAIETDGTIKAVVRVTDPRGLPLDRLGVTTPGNVAMSFVAAHIPANADQYVAYTTRVQTSPITGQAATQASADSGGSFRQIADGEYEYTFGRRAPAGYDRSATHTISVYGSRNLSEFELGTNYDEKTFNFVPAGGEVTKVRDVVKTATCNKCHDPLALHGGPRRTMEGCILCHQPQTSDPDTGNTVDMVVMTHKIHMGANLPSVQAGTPYVIIGNRQSVHDYSEVLMPSDARNCFVCHEQDGPRKAAQSDRVFKASRAACGSCHDNVDFATGEGHVNLPQVSDNQCTTCHTPQGELPFDASIIGAHTVPENAPQLPGITFEAIRVDDGMAGKQPTLTFSIKDREGNPVPPSQMTRLALVLAGPTSDYATYVSEDARQAQGSDGTYFWTFGARIPEGTKGSYTIGIEGYRNHTLLPGTQKAVTVRDAGINKVIHFTVDGTPVQPRRQIVTNEKCNACHYKLSLHGGNRNQVEQCILCHNPNETDIARRPAGARPAESVDMRTMIHRIHTGHEMLRDYTVYGFGGTPHNYNHVGYPGDRRNCTACHIDGTQQLPLPETALNVTDPRGLINPVGPETAACTSCHGSRAAASHALANTTQLGESCAACHGPNSAFSVDRSHAR
ncbi:MAG: OmcA/MtrC family decaheme c-type cytochrome [Bryobacterales bacterium]|nr:OmcA/MtrC family decaheme c-type cytochrome [Bryobacterales bacterium]